jgi:hypothetical protein
MPLDTRRSNRLLLLLILALHLHHALSQTTNSSLSFSLTTISDLTTFFTSTIIVSNSTTQLASTIINASSSSSFVLTSTPETSQASGLASPTASSSSVSSSSASATTSSAPPPSPAPYTSMNPPSRFTTIATLTKRFRSDQGRESRNWRWCWHRRCSDFYRVSINVLGALEHAESKMLLTIRSVQVCSIFANRPDNQLLRCKVRPFKRHRR